MSTLVKLTIATAPSIIITWRAIFYWTFTLYDCRLAIGILSPWLVGMLLFGVNKLENLKNHNNCTLTIDCKNCPQLKHCSNWDNFIEKHSDIKSYAHFDKRTSLSNPRTLKYILNINNIKSHNFYPFIHFSKTKKKFTQNKENMKTPNPRDLFYCSHLDRCVYQRYAFLLNEKYNVFAQNNHINSVAIAYRDNLGKTNIDFAKEAFRKISSLKNAFIFVSDFEHFFDNINHEYLKKKLCELLTEQKLPEDYYAVYKNITKFAFWEWEDIIKCSYEDEFNTTSKNKNKSIVNKRDKILTNLQFKSNTKYIKKNHTNIGIPQGSPISAVLSNIYMIDFDKLMSHYVKSKNGTYMRYSDDLIIILPLTQKEDITNYKKEIFDNISTMGNYITLSQEKTHVYLFENNSTRNEQDSVPTEIDYLGFLFDGNKIKIRPRSLGKYYYRMQRKAKTLRERDWTSYNGKFTFKETLYNNYGRSDKRSFISYLDKANKIINLSEDPEAQSLLNNVNHKIQIAIKKKRKKRKN